MKYILSKFVKIFGMPFENGKYAYHYFFPDTGAFKLITEQNFSKPEEYVEYINKNNIERLAQTYDYDYFVKRIEYERCIKEKFIQLGGKIERDNPYYMTWGYSWMNNRSTKKIFLRTPLENIDLRYVSFTYGDSFSAFNPDNKKYNREYYAKVYNYEQIKEIVKKYGFPSQWNKKAKKGYESYIEMQIWKNDFMYEKDKVEYSL